MSINEFPSIYIHSCNNEDPLKIIQSIKNEDNIEIYKNEGDIFSYHWELDCKYYTAEVQLCTSNNLKNLSSAFIENINAIIILFNQENENIMESLNECLSLVEQSRAEVLLLLSEKCIEYDSSSKKIFDWCQKYHFELVVLEEDAIELDIVGIERVRQALYAHYWPNLKAKCDITHPSTKSIIEGSVVNCALSEELSDLKMDEAEDTELDSNLFSEMFEGDINFFQTFDKVRKLKEQISAMPDEERKDAAEKALTECWKAFFGEDVDL
ncbi:alpha- and gamma-adaptin-binding protein p34-like isoform X1 [Daktulosphaira vitifoliae]|uniref:alpha- and gamma-adaptin-binding protein p34-like isoform X1 n=1 Tax=Daktulosphaira vitifoliae TaxID=58002 RepID=UPI0021AAC1E8|nr:alpha- and gamma-adaptin-binding protein p34-like isoform X1 [Daktulosphaira vitifoliae]